MSSDQITRQTLVDRIRIHANEIYEDEFQYAPLLAQVGDAQIVLIGEASHGTQQFYQMRADFTKKLIEEKGFSIVAAEADYPDAYRVNRYVHARSNDSSSKEALGDFTRFPTWMWRNTVVMEFVDWLHAYNQNRNIQKQAGFYGMDLYSLNSSIEAVLKYLEKVDPEAAQRARYRYSCFDHYGEDPQTNGYAASFDLTGTCTKETVEQLVDLRRQAYDYMRRDGFVAEDEYFYAEQNARIAKNAEEYYRTMFSGRDISWNLRDQHMMETLEALLDHNRNQGKPAKAVVWAHNSHLGDARFTEMSRRGELNLGQLVRQHFGKEAVSIGFTTYTGTVTAASGWDGFAERKWVRPGMPGSYAWIFHATGMPRFLLNLDSGQEAVAELGSEHLERAIGVIYRPETERISHYFYAQLMGQFNAVIHLDETQALEPLERGVEWEQGEEVPETYPSGL